MNHSPKIRRGPLGYYLGEKEMWIEFNIKISKITI